MKAIAAVVFVLLLATAEADAQNQSITINRNYSYSYRNRTTENLGYAQLGLTAFLALLDSGTGVRQNGVPAPGYPTYPGAGPGGAWGPGAVVVAPPVVVDGAVVCTDPSWCTFPSPLGPGPGADGFAAGYDAGRQWAREHRIAGAVQYHQDYSAGMDAGAAAYGW